ncbi:ASN_HP2_G0016420.mRNA.1.CDS.1 [Saccharomyces cerevisiae]|nr:ASN_HP2_G0016420.mRNA.1.CDS.1 [Saccharomyces cerevisiae]CAI6528914.1 ASN_HP2_G0016420.mRNA.1.CDS.1 [Saccharomyces cerevisiae]
MNWMRSSPHWQLSLSTALNILSALNSFEGPQQVRVSKSTGYQIENNSHLDSIDAKILNDLKKRKLILKERHRFQCHQRPSFLNRPHQNWKRSYLRTGLHQCIQALKFNAYNFNSQGVQISSGALHPLNKVRGI